MNITRSRRWRGPVVQDTLLVVFFPLFILAALTAWLLVLAHASRRAAEAETGHQTDHAAG